MKKYLLPENSNFYKANLHCHTTISDGRLTPEEIEPLNDSGIIGVGWASSGGEAAGLLKERYLAADGIENVINVLEELEDEKLNDLDFIELNCCTGGCVGGVLTMQNPFIAKARLQTLRRYLPVSQNTISKDEKYVCADYLFEDMPTYKSSSRLGSSIAESMRMMADIQKLKESLPGIDCGACGAPNCRAFAEDVIKNTACSSDCPIKSAAELKKSEENL